MSAQQQAIVPRCEISVRPATLADVRFMDKLQKANKKALGYFPTQQFVSYIELNAVLIAEEGGRPVGYVISRDRYLKRDELGVIYQLCVAPEAQRKLVGACLVREVFARSAYGCRLYCCWCAQDLEANHFWESLGFLPIAFRGGSSAKRRTHIFWQRRIVEGDETAFWYPSQTNQGAIRADRLVFPIPPGVHWKDVSAIATPGEKNILPGARRRPKKAEPPPPPQIAPNLRRPRMQSGRPPVPKPEDIQTATVTISASGDTSDKPPKIMPDPKQVAAARELRDRYLERFNQGSAQANAKYEVAKALPSPTSPASPPQLPEAA